jgi:hypothetical protein
VNLLPCCACLAADAEPDRLSAALSAERYDAAYRVLDVDPNISAQAVVRMCAERMRIGPATGE